MKRLVSLIVAGLAVAAGSAFALAGGVASASSHAGSAAALPTLTLTMNGKKIVAAGSEVSGAVRVVSTVTGEAQGEPTLFRLNPGASPAKAFAALAAAHGDLNALTPYGGFVFNAAAPKGTSSAQTLLVPANYVALDTSQTGSGGQPPNTGFTVTKSPHPAALPKPAATITAIDFAFRGPATLHKGTLVRFQNKGYVVHMIVWNSAKNLKNAKAAIAALQAGHDNKAQKLATGGGTFAGPLSTGGLQQLVVNEKPGFYLLACFMNTQDGREHTQIGMERLLKIAK